MYYSQDVNKCANLECVVNDKSPFHSIHGYQNISEYILFGFRRPEAVVVK